MLLLIAARKKDADSVERLRKFGHKCFTYRAPNSVIALQKYMNTAKCLLLIDRNGTAVIYFLSYGILN